MTPQSLDMIAKLVGFDTVSRNSNLELIHYVRDYLAAHGVRAHIVSSPGGTKANLFATVGPNEPGGVVLSGHTDVVPVDGQAWDTDPFTLVRKDGRLYGRGTCDMKSFIAIGLAMVPELLRRPLKRPVHFALSYDEEIGCFGAPSMIDRLVTDIKRPSAVIVGEPTSMRPVVAHKGIAALRTTVTGYEAHSSQVQRGVSAVTIAARLISFIDDMMAENKAAADPASPFVPPYTTLHVGAVHGGTAINIISRECSFIWDIRTIPGDNWRHYLTRLEEFAETLLADARNIYPHASVATEVMADAPPLRDQGGAAQALVFQLCGHSHGGVVPFAAEGGQFQQRGFDVVLCGPGSIDQAHKPNEYIETDQVSACERFLDQLADRLATS